ncbi:DNA gyrase inhibitor YacG [Maricaulis maris]|uniref:DNA gyrase inhibitor YacG n=1 Tax=Maricaulis maris TaxID=74318 RepID=UPI003B8EA2AD
MKCPICRQPADPEFKPFCSKRCADVDLGKWVSGSYAIPGEAADVAEDNPASEEDQ